MPGGSDITRQQFDSATGGQLITLATLVSGEDQANNVLRSAPKSGFWKTFSVPAVTTAPSASQASAGGGVKNVCTGFILSLTAVAAQTVIWFTLRDGATGTGTILLQIPVIQAVGSAYSYSSGPLYVPGTAATAMTLELTNQAGTVTNPVATNFAAILMWGNTEQ